MFVVNSADNEDNEDYDINSAIESYIEDIVCGEKEAIGHIYDLTKTMVYGYVLSILKNPTDAEDILQDTYVKIAVSADMYSAQGKPMAWIYTIARNLSLMKIRKDTRNADIPDFEWDQFEAPNSKFGSDDRIVLGAALSNLSEEERNIVMLHAVGGMKHREIAEFLDMPLATVLSKYNRSLKKLKNILSEGQ